MKKLDRRYAEDSRSLSRATANPVNAVGAISVFGSAYKDTDRDANM